jgi:TnpA family transposase
LYRPSRNCEFEAISHLFSATVDWSLIERHYPDFIRLALAIHSGELAPSAVLTRINSQSSRDPFSSALQELGHAVRTRFLLRWTWDEDLRHAVHKGTTKVERNHQFSKFLNFGSEGGLKTNNPADQEKAIVYNELVANAVAACRFPRSLSNPSVIDVQLPCRTAIHASSWTSIHREWRYSGGQCA